jgi:hypothetical protein
MDIFETAIGHLRNTPLGDRPMEILGKGAT